MKRSRTDRMAIRSEVLTLRMTPEEMLRFRVAALTIGKKRAAIVRERVADLIGAPRDEQATPDRATTGEEPNANG